MSSKLSRREIREVESSLEVYLDELSMTYEHRTQRFNVFDNSENENFIAEVTAENLFFKRKELEKAIAQLDGIRQKY